MIPNVPQLATAVGRPPMTGGVSAPNPAAAPRLAAPAVNTGRVGRPPMPGGGAPAPQQKKRGFFSKLGGALTTVATGGLNKIPGAGKAANVATGGMISAGRSLASKFAGGPKPSPQIAQGAVGGWNADPSLVQNAVKVLKAGAELGPQHRGPLNQLLANTDRPNPGPYQRPEAGPAMAEGFASKFGGGFA